VGVPVPNTQMKVVDVVTREALPPNQNGEICVRGPQVKELLMNII
jgi:acyl-CoA synthetase (AMP-forming)/AMP-acid ligase II